MCTSTIVMKFAMLMLQFASWLLITSSFAYVAQASCFQLVLKELSFTFYSVPHLLIWLGLVDFFLKTEIARSLCNTNYIFE